MLLGVIHTLFFIPTSSVFFLRILVFVFFFDRQARDWQRAYMKRILTHVNPHTGPAYKDDPALAVVETGKGSGCC